MLGEERNNRYNDIDAELRKKKSKNIISAERRKKVKKKSNKC